MSQPRITTIANQELTARLEYLNKSAHLLSNTAPSTSKYLMSKCNSLMFDNEIEQSEPQKRKICGACGTIMVLGWEATMEVKSKSSKKKKVGSKRPSSEMVYTCGSCNKKTRLPLDPAPPIVRHNKGMKQSGGISRTVATPVQAVSTTNTSSIPSANANSKKRAKTRKLGGLGALLANKKASEARSSGFGLDLMDLMKKT